MKRDKNFWTAFCIIAGVQISFVGLIAYVAWHFISKFW